MRSLVVAGALALAACAPEHLRALGLSGGGRELPELFLGGWDGRRLGVFDDSQVEPGVTTRSQLVRVLGVLSSDLYAVVYVEKARLDAEAARHGLTCDAPMCLVVFERKGGDSLARWGAALAVFELKGAGDDAIGPVWLSARAIRPPGPTRWDRLCLTRSDTPRYVHPDGAAIFPARPGLDGDAFALFGPTDEPASYRRDGFAAPSARLCDEELVRQQGEPEPERPKLDVDPSILREK